MREWTAQVTFINVGNGDSILIEACDPNCRDGVFVMVIDGGSGEDSEYADQSTGRIRAVDYLQKRGIGHIDVMVCTHIHEDHTCGLLPIAFRWPPEFLWQPFPVDLSEIMEFDGHKAETEAARKFTAARNDYAALCRYIKGHGGQVLQMTPGYTDHQSLHPAGGLRMKILGPAGMTLDQETTWLEALYRDRRRDLLTLLDSHMNNSSLILHVSCGKRTFLLTGDTERSGYEACMADIRADVWKVGHHGQTGSITPGILQAVSPKAAVICASSDRRYDSAAPAVLEMLCTAGIPVYYSDCPEVLPYPCMTDPHHAVIFQVMHDGTLHTEYEKILCYFKPHYEPIYRSS